MADELDKREALLETLRAGQGAACHLDEDQEVELQVRLQSPDSRPLLSYQPSFLATFKNLLHPSIDELALALGEAVLVQLIHAHAVRCARTC